MINTIKKIIIILPFLLLGCETESVNNVDPSGAISTQPNSTTLTVTVKDGINQSPLARAQAKIILSDGTLVIKETNDNGIALFSGLVEGNSYNVEVTANGYVAKSASTISENITIKSNTNSVLNINMYKSLGSFSGKVVAETGENIEGVVIQAGNNSALSDSEGKFKVDITSLTKQDINLSKIGYKNLNYGSLDFNLAEKDKSAGNIKLSKKDAQILIVFDTGKKPFGDDGFNNFTGLSESLVDLGYKVNFEDFSTRQNNDDVDILVIASPSQEYSSLEIEKISNFVKQGKKLVVLGEWGGYSNFNANSVNNIIKQANLKINPDVVKETVTANIIKNDEQIISNNITQHFITKDVNKLSFYSSASVELINGGVQSINSNTSLIAYNSSKGFRIQVYNKGQFAFIGTSVLGLGKIVVLGDSSIFMSVDSDLNGTSNIDEFNNRQLLKNILTW